MAYKRGASYNGVPVERRIGFDLSDERRHDRAVISTYIVNGAVRLEYEDIYREAKGFFKWNKSVLKTILGEKTVLELQPSGRLLECIEKGRYSPDSPPWENLSSVQLSILEDIMTACKRAVENSNENTVQNVDEISRFSDMGSYEFEELVADIWSNLGWLTEVTSASADAGVDIVAKKSDPVQEKALIQAKCYSKGNKVTSKEIQQYSSLKKQENGDKVIVVTSSSFTKDAKQRAKDLNVKTVNGEKLNQLASRYS